MPFVVISSGRYAVGAPASTGLFSDIVEDLNYFNGLIISQNNAGGSPLVLNGSFESPLVASSTVPNNWTIVNGDAGAAVLSNPDQNHGAQSLKFTRDTTGGHTGGTATSDTFFTVSPYQRYWFIFMIKSTRADVSNSVTINWYDATQGPLSSTTIYSKTSAPTTWQDERYAVSPPALAMFGKIVIAGGTSTTTPGGTASVYFDGFSFSLKPNFSEPIFYGASTTITCGTTTGAYPGWWRVRLYGQEGTFFGAAGTPGGYAETVAKMRFGDTATITISPNSAGTNKVVFSNQDGSSTMTATNAQLGAAGVATGGSFLSLGGGSSLQGAGAYIEY